MNLILAVLLAGAAYYQSQPMAIEQMLDLAQVTSADTVYDLGSGDGRIVIAAAKRGAKAIGIEMEAEEANRARDNIRQAKINAEIRTGDFYVLDFSDATVVVLYVGNAEACKLKSRLQALRAGTRIVSNGEGICGWTPTRFKGLAILWVIQ